MPPADKMADGPMWRWTKPLTERRQGIASDILLDIPTGRWTVSRRLPPGSHPHQGHGECLSPFGWVPASRYSSQDTHFRFGRNMRQSRQIGRFLQGFHEAAFGEIAPFDVNPDLTDTKPRLVLAPRQINPSGLLSYSMSSDGPQS